MIRGLDDEATSTMRMLLLETHFRLIVPCSLYLYNSFFPQSDNEYESCFVLALPEKEDQSAMSYIITAYWKAKTGQEEAILNILRQFVPLSRKEEGCLEYRVHRSVRDPCLFFLYEKYVSADEYEAHVNSSHFERFVTQEAMPLLEHRERAFYETLDI
jgi:quinol monooxygenase YgiN